MRRQIAALAVLILTTTSVSAQLITSSQTTTSSSFNQQTTVQQPPQVLMDVVPAPACPNTAPSFAPLYAPGYGYDPRFLQTPFYGARLPTGFVTVGGVHYGPVRGQFLPHRFNGTVWAPVVGGVPLRRDHPVLRGVPVRVPVVPPVNVNIINRPAFPILRGTVRVATFPVRAALGFPGRH